MAVCSLLPRNSVFQTTTTSERPVSAAGLEGAMKLLPKCDSYKLYFPVPEHIYDTFTQQPFAVNEDTEVRTRQGRVRKVRQYALKVSMRPSPLSAPWRVEKRAAWLRQ